MNGKLEYCLQALAERIDSQPVDDISADDRNVLIMAARRDYRGEGSITCPVPNCVTRCRVEVLSGKIAMSEDRKSVV